jgi:formamidopyrimidine-DNA glycosylase
LPELPEVETTRRGIRGEVNGRIITAVRVRNRALRWPLPARFERQLIGRKILDVGRRGKYLLMGLDRGTLIVHLGMSGTFRLYHASSRPKLHDHVDIVLDNGWCLRFNDPRRFGSMHFTAGLVEDHPLIAHLGPEPLSMGFNDKYLAKKARGRSIPVKQFLMDGRVVVGVGNIYASEALFRAGIKPTRRASKLKNKEIKKLLIAVKEILADAISKGGTTLHDFVDPNGMPGAFQSVLEVYDRKGLPCNHCGALIKSKVLAGRSTFWCPECQQ